MIVYGDQVRLAAASDVLDNIEARIGRAGSSSDPLDRLNAIASLILAGELQQALEDLEAERRGLDDLSGLGLAASTLTLAAARFAAGAGGYESLGAPLRCLRRLSPAVPLTLKQPEGYAFYAVHPLSYFEAARAFGTEIQTVIGLRSIGTSLGAVVAAGAGLDRFFTLRPVGNPFARRIVASRALLDAVRDREGAIAIVDEGPGLSGSSFGAAADWLEDAGVDPERLLFFPSHPNPPGAQASERHRARWARARKAQPRPVGAACLGAFSTGEDLSGGLWRRVVPLDAPADPSRERLKRRFQTDEGRALSKFAGYGGIGERKLAIAETLHGAGFGPRPIALVDGFLATAWVEGTPGIETVVRADLIARAGDYLACRAARFPAHHAGASLRALFDMARHNFRECGLDHAASALDRFDLERLQNQIRPVLIDARLHPWEWIVDPEGKLLKLDALDHHAGHDLVGPQDIAWDLAGAAVEFGLSPAEIDSLLAAFGGAADPDLLALHRLFYLGFQIGLWTMAHEGAAPEDRPPIEALLAKYRDAL